MIQRAKVFLKQKDIHKGGVRAENVYGRTLRENPYPRINMGVGFRYGSKFKAGSPATPHFNARSQIHFQMLAGGVLGTSWDRSRTALGGPGAFRRCPRDPPGLLLEILERGSVLHNVVPRKR